MFATGRGCRAHFEWRALHIAVGNLAHPAVLAGLAQPPAATIMNVASSDSGGWIGLQDGCVAAAFVASSKRYSKRSTASSSSACVPFAAGSVTGSQKGGSGVALQAIRSRKPSGCLSLARSVTGDQARTFEVSADRRHAAELWLATMAASSQHVDPLPSHIDQQAKNIKQTATSRHFEPFTGHCRLPKCHVAGDGG